MTIRWQNKKLTGLLLNDESRQETQFVWGILEKIAFIECYLGALFGNQSLQMMNLTNERKLETLESVDSGRRRSIKMIALSIAWRLNLIIK